LNTTGHINNLRRKLTRFFSGLLLISDTSEADFNQNISQVKKILICRPNHRLGNNLLLTPLVNELTKIFPNSEIHLFTKGDIGDLVFENFKDVVRLIKLPRKPFKNLIEYFTCWFAILDDNYDLVINSNEQSSSGILATKLSKSKYKFYNILNDKLTHFKDYKHHAKNPIYNIRYQVKNQLDRVNKKIPKLDVKLRNYEIQNGEKLLKSMFRNQKPVISIFTFATGDKCLSKHWWIELYSKIKNFQDNYNVLEILPAENISQIDFAAKTYYSRDVREIASVMSNVKIFIGADSGIMHLAHASKTKTIGLFNVSKPEFYGVYGNGNMSVDTKITSINKLINLIESELA